MSYHFLFTFCCIYFAVFACAAPHTVPSLLSRQDSSLIAEDDIAQAINTTITDHSGQDITSSFQIRVFYDPSTRSNDTTPTNTSTTDDGLMNRQTASYRHITFCPTPSATFLSSECKPVDGQPGSLQAYTITCQRTRNDYHPYTGEFLYSRPHTVQRDGHCWGDEICINGFGPGNEILNLVGRRFANCVKWRNFRVVKPPIGLKLDKQSVLRALKGKRLSMVMSKDDKSTPLEVDTFDVEASGRAVDGTKMGNGAGAGTAGTVDGDGVDKCRDCMDLETHQFTQDVASLRAEARMLTTGAAFAGILWLALI